MDELIGALGGHRLTAGQQDGELCGQGRLLASILLTGFKTQHTSLALYIVMRAAVLASLCGIKSKRFGKICKPLTWKHGEVLTTTYVQVNKEVCLHIKAREFAFFV